MNTFIGNTGDNANALKEAIERTEAAEAYQREMYAKKFGNDKDYAARYMEAKKRRAGGR